MAKRIGALSATLTLKSQQFSRGMKKARFGVKRFGRSVSGMVGRLKSFSLISGVSVGAFGFLVKQQLKAADASAKLSDRLGISIGALEGFRLAAELGGASIEGADNALQQFARRLGDAQSGTGEYADAIKEIGLRSDDLASVPLDVALGKVADQINLLKNDTLKANAAYNLFGRQGIKLLNTLAGGSEGLAKAREEIEGTGLAIERFEARKIELANDAMTRLKFTVRGMARTFIVELAPLITAFAQQIRAMIPNMQLLGQVSVDVLRNVSLAFAKMGRILLSIASYVAGLNLLEELLFGTPQSLQAARDFADEIRAGLKQLSDDSINDFFDKALESAAKATAGVSLFNAAMGRSGRGLGAGGKGTFANAIEQGTQAATKATFLFAKGKTANENAPKDILRLLKQQFRKGTPNLRSVTIP